jgi:hypothetical protein
MEVNGRIHTLSRRTALARASCTQWIGGGWALEPVCGVQSLIRYFGKVKFPADHRLLNARSET